MTSQTTYNLISLVWHPNSSESMHVGIWMNDGHHVMFDYNPVRLELASKLMPQGEWRLVKSVLQNLKSCISPNQQSNNLDLASEWGIDSMSYLGRYANNLLRVGPSVPIALELTQTNFQRMCQRHLGMSGSTAVQKRTRIERRVKEFMSSHLNTYTTLDAHLDSNDLNGLLFPVTIPSLGINEIPFVCEILDFENRIDAITHKVGDILNLKEAFAASQYKHATYFVIGNEPTKREHPVHQVWSSLRQSQWIKVVPEAEKEAVVDYAREHDVKPWAVSKA